MRAPQRAVREARRDVNIPLAHRSGALLGLLLTLNACGDIATTPAGPRFAPCEVTLAPSSHVITYRQEGLQAQRHGELWRAGPLHTWSTTPNKRCARELITPDSAEVPGRAIFATWPTAQAPRDSGDGSVAPGRWPVVIFAHANHCKTCESYRSYQLLHHHWSSWGYLVLSVDDSQANGEAGNAQNIRERAATQRSALEALRVINADPDHPLYQRVDLDRVVLAGHSRGGGASLLNAADEAAGVRAAMSIQGVSLASFGLGWPALHRPALAIIAGNDPDLGFPHIDAFEPVALGPYSWVTLHGATHNYTADARNLHKDAHPEISREQQHQLTQYFTTAFLAHHVGVISPHGEITTQDHSDVVYGFEGATRAQDAISPVGVSLRWRAPDERALMLDDFDELARKDTSLRGDPYRYDNLFEYGPYYTYAPDAASLPARSHREARAMRLRVLYPGESAPDDSGDDAVQPPSSTPPPGRWHITLEPPVPLHEGVILTAQIRAGLEEQDLSFALTLHTDAGATTYSGDTLIGPHPLTDRFTQLVARSDRGALLEAIELSLEGGLLMVDELRLLGAGDMQVLH